ncbi:MAG: hypothetical protein WAQ24_04160 [Candidatus Saccharimonadales bacterium]
MPGREQPPKTPPPELDIGALYTLPTTEPPKTPPSQPGPGPVESDPVFAAFQATYQPPGPSVQAPWPPQTPRQPAATPQPVKTARPVKITPADSSQETASTASTAVSKGSRYLSETLRNSIVRTKPRRFATAVAVVSLTATGYCIKAETTPGQLLGSAKGFLQEKFIPSEQVTSAPNFVPFDCLKGIVSVPLELEGKTVLKITVKANDEEVAKSAADPNYKPQVVTGFFEDQLGLQQAALPEAISKPSPNPTPTATPTASAATTTSSNPTSTASPSTQAPKSATVTRLLHAGYTGRPEFSACPKKPMGDVVTVRGNTATINRSLISLALLPATPKNNGQAWYEAAKFSLPTGPSIFTKDEIENLNKRLPADTPNQEYLKYLTEQSLKTLETATCERAFTSSVEEVLANKLKDGHPSLKVTFDGSFIMPAATFAGANQTKGPEEIGVKLVDPVWACGQPVKAHP